MKDLQPLLMLPGITSSVFMLTPNKAPSDVNSNFVKNTSCCEKDIGDLIKILKDEVIAGTARIPALKIVDQFLLNHC